MTPERHRRIGQVYNEALELPPERRKSFVASTCGGDAALVREVESLLDFDATETSLLDGSALTVLGQSIAIEQSRSWIGRQVGHYRVLSWFDGGGMGELYRAHDVRLDRDVAIKALPLIYASDEARLQRFEQEARAAGQLNHPNVLTVYDVGVHDGAPFIVAELLEGETLGQQLKRGPFPPRRAIDYAQQIARGLAAAHAKGIIHRDLKPGNLFVTDDGRLKILDFGLAELKTIPALQCGTRPTSQPTTAQTGFFVGTMGYVSPEYLRGEAADQRFDIFSFGVILYEMLTGERPFQRESGAEVIQAILEEEPRDVSEVNPAIAPLLAKIVRRCLEKVPAQRFQSAGDLGFALEAIGEAPAPSASLEVPTLSGGSSAGRKKRSIRLGLAFAALAAVAITASIWNSGETVSPEPAVARFTLPVAAGRLIAGDLAVSPDGAYVAYSMGRRGAKTLLIHKLDNPEPTPVVELANGSRPFFSPDSQWLGYFADGRLKKVSVHGGSSFTVADAPVGTGAGWSEQGTIVFAPNARTGLFQVSAKGGSPTPLTTPDAARRETSHTSPQWLPGGNAVVHVARLETSENALIEVFSVADRRTRVLVTGGDHVRYISTGHLVYLDRRQLMAAPFDLSRLEVTGAAVPVLDDVAAYGVSESGSLIYSSDAMRGLSTGLLTWVTREGVAQPIGAPLHNYAHPRLSPDGRRVMVTIAAPEKGIERDIWIYDLARSALSRLTFEGRGSWPVWSHDGRRAIYASLQAGTSWDIFSKPTDGTAAPEALLVKPLLQIPHTVSRNGRWLGFTAVGPEVIDVALVTMGERKVDVALGPGRSPSLSPDGRWIAYASNESGRYEVYVRPTSGEGKWLISSDGGVEPLWSAGGDELFYRNGESMLAVDVVMQGDFEHRTPRVLFRGPYALDGLDSREYDVTADSQRFLMIKGEPEPVTNHLKVVVNWQQELKRLVPPR